MIRHFLTRSQYREYKRIHSSYSVAFDTCGETPISSTSSFRRLGDVVVNGRGEVVQDGGVIANFEKVHGCVVDRRGHDVEDLRRAL